LNNYEKIKNMSIEEMAEFLEELSGDKKITCNLCRTFRKCQDGLCITIKQYLQQEATNE